MIESEYRIKDQPTMTERRYYLRSLDGGVERFAYVKRGHMTLIRKIALNLLTKEASKGSKKRKQLKAGRDNDYLMKVLIA